MNLATPMEPLHERIMVAIADFNGRHPEWDTTITSMDIEPSARGRGPGLSCYVRTMDGMGFEIPLQPGDDVAATLGEAIH